MFVLGAFFLRGKVTACEAEAEAEAAVEAEAEAEAAPPAGDEDEGDALFSLAVEGILGALHHD